MKIRVITDAPRRDGGVQSFRIDAGSNIFTQHPFLHGWIEIVEPDGHRWWFNSAALVAIVPDDDGLVQTVE